jgi:hypothetical protein
MSVRIVENNRSITPTCLLLEPVFFWTKHISVTPTMRTLTTALRTPSLIPHSKIRPSRRLWAAWRHLVLWMRPYGCFTGYTIGSLYGAPCAALGTGTAVCCFCFGRAIMGVNLVRLPRELSPRRVRNDTKLLPRRSPRSVRLNSRRPTTPSLKFLPPILLMVRSFCQAVLLARFRIPLPTHAL